MRRKWIQDRQTGKLIEVDPNTRRYRPQNSAAIIPDIEPFKSPVDGTTIGSRTHLRAHQERHDVRLHGEYGENNGKDWFERANRERMLRASNQDAQSRQERREALIQAINERT